MLREKRTGRPPVEQDDWSVDVPSITLAELEALDHPNREAIVFALRTHGLSLQPANSDYLGLRRLLHERFGGSLYPFTTGALLLLDRGFLTHPKRRMRAVRGDGYVDKGVLAQIERGNHINYTVFPHVSTTGDELSLVEAQFKLRTSFLGIPTHSQLIIDGNRIPDADILTVTGNTEGFIVLPTEE